MFRSAMALGVVTVAVATASAQPGRLPLSPGVMPGSPIGPGTQFLPQSGMSGGMYRPPPFNRGWFVPGYYPYAAFGFGGGFPYGYGAPPIVIEVVPPQPQPRPVPNVVLANEFPATLTLQFPAAADVWLDGKKVTAAPAEEQVVTSPVLRPDERFTFQVKARWTSGGKTYEAKRSVTLGSGDRSRLFVVSGDEVKE
jgi:uncharacterized protein (TIGR03000 family)